MIVAQSCPTLCHPMDCSRQAPLSLGFSRQQYWTGFPFPSPGDRPNPGIEPGSPPLQADSLPSEPPVFQAFYLYPAIYMFICIYILTVRTRSTVTIFEEQSRRWSASRSRCSIFPHRTGGCSPSWVTPSAGRRRLNAR